MLCAVLLLFVGNLIYGLENMRRRVVFFVFHLAFFTFILSRPTISMLHNRIWWYFAAPAVQFSLNALFTTMIFLRIGAELSNKMLKKSFCCMDDCVNIKGKTNFIEILQFVSLLFYLLTMAVNLVLGIEKMLYAIEYGYESIYITYKSRFPYYMSTIGSMMKYGLCLFLATLPEKKKAFVPLALYFVSTVPSLVSGVRNPIVLAAIFIVLYYAIRDIIGDKDIWLGKTEKTLIVFAIPAAVIFLGAYNYIRADKAVSLSLLGLVEDFFYKQGTTFDVLSKAYLALPDLPDAVQKNYTFGPFIDYIMHGTIGQKIFGTIDLGSGNSAIKAIYGNSFAHSMSYIVHPNYLGGEGHGSSYLLELFADWEYLGIVSGSLILGFLLILMMVTVRQNKIMVRTITLICLLSVFFVPRADVTGWLLFLITLQFWAAIICCYFLTILICLLKEVSSKMNISL